MIQEVILIIMLGFSPGGATGAKMKVLEYKQESMAVCKKEELKINTTISLRSFSNPQAFCVTRIKE